MNVNENTRYDVRLDDAQRMALMHALTIATLKMNTPNDPADYSALYDMLRVALPNDAPDNTLNDFTA